MLSRAAAKSARAASKSARARAICVSRRDTSGVLGAGIGSALTSVPLPLSAAVGGPAGAVAADSRASRSVSGVAEPSSSASGPEVVTTLAGDGGGTAGSVRSGPADVVATRSAGGSPSSSRASSASATVESASGPAASRWSATFRTAPRNSAPAYRESADAGCGPGGSTSVSADSQARAACSAAASSETALSAAAAAKSSYADCQIRSEALAATESSPGVQDASRTMRNCVSSSGVSRLSPTVSRPLFISAAVRWTGPGVKPASSSWARLIIASEGSGAGLPTTSASASWSAIQRRWASERSTRGTWSAVERPPAVPGPPVAV
ncbi:hypothetical protein AN220_13405 [Streptomyces nanshensis]|nr:hypothetical protein AN220_13405 [Streptomyces nanshensis]